MNSTNTHTTTTIAKTGGKMSLNRPQNNYSANCILPEYVGYPYYCINKIYLHVKNNNYSAKYLNRLKTE